MARKTFDPVNLEILWGRLVSMVDEAAAAFRRTSFSTLVRESNDFAVVMTDHKGRSLAQNSSSIPSFIGTLPETVKHVLARYPLKTMRPGDVFITNDPWMGTGHVDDVCTVLPVFHRGKPVAFSAATSHVPDIGGRLRNPGIREIYEEGLQIPRLRLMAAGKPVETVVEFIETNVRVPEQTMGDIWGQVAAHKMLEGRLTLLLDETKVDLAALSREVRRRSEEAMRAAIAELPDGTYRYVTHQDGFEERIVIDCKITIEGGTLAIDYTGSSPGLPRAVNVVPIYTFAYSAFAVKALLCPDVPNNEGSFLPISTYAPPGSILNAEYPIGTGARALVGHMLPAAVMGALAPLLPERVWAEGASNSSFNMTGTHQGRRFAVISFLNAGQGATAARDGHSALSFPSNLGNNPIEVMESQAPLLVHHRKLRRRTGGRGRQRGGDGIDMALTYTGDGPAVCSFMMPRMIAPPQGLMGGGPGAEARLLLNGEAVDLAQHWVLSEGDHVLMQTAGGGGFGKR